MNEELDLNPIRGEGESFEDYRTRIKEAKKALKVYLRGKPVFIANHPIEIPTFDSDGGIKYDEDGNMVTKWTITPPFYLTSRFGPIKNLR